MRKLILLLLCACALSLNVNAFSLDSGVAIIDSSQLKQGLFQTNDPDSNSVVIQTRVKSPKKAALLSALIPGAGQIYNGGWGYVKAPLVWGGFGALGAGIISYERDRRFFLDVMVLKDLDSSSTFIASFIDAHKDRDKVTTLTGVQFASISQAELKLSYNSIRSNLQNLYLFSVVWYGLNVLDAVVDAHLKSFDVSDDLSLKINPGLYRTSNHYGSIRPMIGISLNFK